MDDGVAVAMAAIATVGHLTRMLANRGLLSPNEVDEIFSSIVEAAQAGSAEMATLIETKLAPAYAAVRETAKERWIGKGQTDPR